VLQDSWNAYSTGYQQEYKPVQSANIFDDLRLSVNEFAVQDFLADQAG
jgi:hypothetical protein